MARRLGARRVRISTGTLAAAGLVLALLPGAAAQGKRSQGAAGAAGPSVGSEREVEVEPASGLVFPRGLQDFEELPRGRSADCIQGWELHSPGAQLFSARAADDVLGAPASRPGSARWLRVSDRSSSDVPASLQTAPVLPPAPWNYVWRFRLLLEELPGHGPAHPALMSAHGCSSGYRDLFGLELLPDGAYLSVRGLGGDPARARLCSWSGASAPGQWLEFELGVDFDRGEVTGRVSGAAPVRLALSPRRDAQLAHFVLRYHGEGLGNTATFLLDDLALAFGASVCEETVLIDFASEDDLVTPLVNGQDLSTPPEFGQLFAIAGAGANAGPAIFDSTPGGPNDPSQDRDLLVGLGNLVILQNNQAAAQSLAGFFDRPNDDQDGGTLFFSFTRPLEVLALDLVDIDQGAVQRATVTLTDQGGRARVYSVPAGWTGDRLTDGTLGFGTLDTTTLLPQGGFQSAATAVQDAGFAPQAVVALAVQFGSSGALDNLALRVPCVQLDFETEDDGASVLANGQDISTPPEFGVHVAIGSSGPNAGAAIFDSTPGGPNDPSQDTDLLVGTGNLLILQNDNAASTLVQTVPGIFDRPNDDADGGALIFTFPAPVQARKLDLVDIDAGLPNGSSVVLTDENGKRRTFTVPAGWTEDLVTQGGSGLRTLDLRNLLPQPGFAAVATASEDAGYDENRVVRVQVNLGSSGALDNFCFCP